ncbi:MAG TPA: MBL fold metallo-hydrolase [Erysipelothrix sp.]|nr:MBL fold metallo-hydrolase [Erysipelothrix sp.]
MLTITTLTLGSFETNCYVLKRGNQAILFDCMIDRYGSIDPILDELKDSNLQGVILTHGHYDHIAGLNFLYEKFPVPIYISKTDFPYLKDPRLNLSAQITDPLVIDLEVNKIEESTLKVGDFTFEVFKTPGHTPGSLSFQIENHVLVGDFLFKNSIGRTDLILGDMAAMKKSLAKAMKWPDDWYIYPGHGPSSQMRYEKKQNPFLKPYR